MGCTNLTHSHSRNELSDWMQIWLSWFRSLLIPSPTAFSTPSAKGMHYQSEALALVLSCTLPGPVRAVGCSIQSQLAQCTRQTPMIAGINLKSAKAKGLPREGALALVMYFQERTISSVCACQLNVSCFVIAERCLPGQALLTKSSHA